MTPGEVNDFVTVARVQADTAMRIVADAWNDLTDEQRDRWHVTGPYVSSRKVIGKAGHLHGRGFFFKVNLPRARLGQELLLKPPAQAGFSRNPAVAFTITPARSSPRAKADRGAETNGGAGERIEEYRRNTSGIRAEHKPNTSEPNAGHRPCARHPCANLAVVRHASSLSSRPGVRGQGLPIFLWRWPRETASIAAGNNLRRNFPSTTNAKILNDENS